MIYINSASLDILTVTSSLVASGSVNFLTNVQITGALYISSSQTSTFGNTNFTGQISASVVNANEFTGSLFGTASQSVSSSYALTASYALNGGSSGNTFPYTGSAIISGSLIITGSIFISSSDSEDGNIIGETLFTGPVTASIISSSFIGNLTGTSSNATSASYASTASYFSGSISNATSASYALTASYALNGGGSGNTFPYTGSAIISGSLTVTGSFRVSGSGYNTLEDTLFTGPVTASVISSSQFIGNLTGTASYASTASYFSGSISNAISSSYALTASYALNGGSSGNVFPYTGSAIISGSLTVTGSFQISSSGYNIIGDTQFVGPVTASIISSSFIGNLTGTASYAVLSSTATSASYVSKSYATVQEDGTPLTQRNVINFVGTGLVAQDDPSNSRTEVTLNSTLNSLASYNQDGFIARSGSDTFVAREILGTENKIIITNGDGIIDNPIITVGSHIVDKTISNTYISGAVQVFSHSSASAGIRIAENFGNPSSSLNGDIWVNSVTDDIYIFIGGITASLSRGIIEDVSTTTYIFEEKDRNKIKRFTHASGCTATIPVGLSENWSVSVYRGAGAGVLTVASDGTLESAGTTLDTEKTMAYIHHRGSDVHIFAGAIGSVTANAFPYTGSAIISGSLLVTGSVFVSQSVIARSFTGSLFGTASQAVSASFAQTARTASYFSGSISNAVSSSYALTASYALNGGSSGNTFPYTGSAIISGSLTVTGSFQISSSGYNTLDETLFIGPVTASIISSSFIGNLTGTASYSTTASYFSGSISNAISASYATTASYFSGSISNAISASYATTASYFSGSISNAISSSYALTASYALNGGSSSGNTFPYTGSAIISGSLIVTGSIEISGVGGNVLEDTLFTGPVTASIISASQFIGNLITPGNIIFEFYNGGDDLTTGVKDTPVRVPFGFVPTGWEMLSYNASNAFVTTSCVVDILSNTFANLPLTGSTDSIAGSEKPTLTSAYTSSNNSLSTWVTMSAGNYVQGEIESVSSGTKKIIVVLKGNKI